MQDMREELPMQPALPLRYYLSLLNSCNRVMNPARGQPKLSSLSRGEQRKRLVQVCTWCFCILEAMPLAAKHALEQEFRGLYSLPPGERLLGFWGEVDGLRIMKVPSPPLLLLSIYLSLPTHSLTHSLTHIPLSLSYTHSR
jgi:hypothetical protein